MVASPLLTDFDTATLPPATVVPQLPYGPQPPAWYTPPPRPDLAKVLAAAEEERAAHADRVAQGFRMLRRINGDKDLAGVFERLVQKVITHEVERIQLPGLRDETDIICSTFAQMDWTVKALYRANFDKEKAHAKEDLCAYLHECAQRQYSRSSGANIKKAKIFDLCVFGGIAEFNGLDLSNDECGLRMRLCDPQTIYPIWEGERGLSAVYSKYRSKASDFIGTFGSLDDFDDEVVRAKAKRAGGGFDPNALGEVVEYWDRHWGLLAWEDQEVCVFAHEYAEVPFTITPGNFGQPAHIAAPDALPSPSGRYWYTDRSEDLKRQWQPFLERRVHLHETKEALAGVVYTKARRSLNPARDVRAGVLTYDDDPPQFSDDEGAVNMLRAEDEAAIDPTSASMDPQVMSAAFALLQQAEATSTPSSIISGQTPMSQGSGTALNVLARAGAERWADVGDVAALHETMTMEQRLRFLRDWGNLLGMDGTLYVPRRRRNARAGQAPVHEVTRELLLETGVRVEVRMGRFNPNELVSLSQGVGMLRSIGLIPKPEAIEVIGYTDDPERALDDLKREMLEEAPAMAQTDMLDMLIADLQEAGWRGDDEETERLFNRLFYVSRQLDISKAQQEGEFMQAQQALQTPPPPGATPGIPAPNAMPGGPGTNGGRPEGSAGPPPVPGLPPVGG